MTIVFIVISIIIYLIIGLIVGIVWNTVSDDIFRDEEAILIGSAVFWPLILSAILIITIVKFTLRILYKIACKLSTFPVVIAVLIKNKLEEED